MNRYEFRLDFEDGFEIAAFEATNLESAAKQARATGAEFTTLLCVVSSTPAECLAF